jgi:hypothetical protein
MIHENELNPRKTVYWRQVKVRPSVPGVYWIEFWSEENKSDLHKEKFVVIEEQRIRFLVSRVLKISSNFELVEK